MGALLGVGRGNVPCHLMATLSTIPYNRVQTGVCYEHVGASSHQDINRLRIMTCAAGCAVQAVLERSDRHGRTQQLAQWACWQPKSGHCHRLVFRVRVSVEIRQQVLADVFVLRIKDLHSAISRIQYVDSIRADRLLHHTVRQMQPHRVRVLRARCRRSRRQALFAALVQPRPHTRPWSRLGRPACQGRLATVSTGTHAGSEMSERSTQCARCTIDRSGRH